VLRQKSYVLNVRKEHNSNTRNCTNLRRGKMYDTEEHVCCHSRMGINAVNLGGEKKNMKFGCQYTYIQNNRKSLAVRHTYKRRETEWRYKNKIFLIHKISA